MRKKSFVKKSFVAMLLLMTCYMRASELVPQGCVIILDGMSNAGKTSIERYLIKHLGSSYSKVALDDFVTDLWLEKKGAYLPEQEFVNRVHQRVDAMYDKVRALVLNGKNVLLDTVLSGLVGENDVSRCFEKLQGLDVMMVLVYCPLTAVVERMKKRNERARLENDPGRERPMIVSLKFADIYHNASSEDLVIDVLSREDVKRTYEPTGELSTDEVKQYEDMKESMLSKFDLHDKQCVKITPCLQYDCIVNTASCTPEGCAQKIHDCLMVSNMRAFNINFVNKMTLNIKKHNEHNNERDTMHAQ